MDRIDSYNYAIFSGRRLFTDGPPGTVVNATWCNSVQEEICAVIEGQGITLNKAENDQLLKALYSIAVPEWVSPWFDVTDYGALPLSSITESRGLDSAPAITRTINAASAATGSARYIVLPPGLYDCRSPVLFGSAYSFIELGFYQGVHAWISRSWKASLIEAYGSRLRFRGTMYAFVCYPGDWNDHRYISHGSGRVGGDSQEYLIWPAYTNNYSLEWSEFIHPWADLTGAETALQKYIWPSTKGLTTHHETVFSVRNLVIDIESMSIYRTPVFIYQSFGYFADETYIFYNISAEGRAYYSTFYNVSGVVPGTGSHVGKERIISRRDKQRWHNEMFRRDMSNTQRENFTQQALDIGY